MRALAQFGWDCPTELVTLTPSQLADILKRFAAGSLSAEQVAEWANALECRDDVAMDDVVKDVIFELANPEITVPLEQSRAARLLARLGQA